MRGDANIDFIISMVLFLSFIVFSIVVVNTIVIPNGASQSELYYQADLVSGMLLSELSYDNKTNILDQRKLDNVTDCDSVVPETTSDFYFVVDTKAKTWSCKPTINISTGLPFIQRPVHVRLANGKETPGIMRVWAWPKVT